MIDFSQEILHEGEQLITCYQQYIKHIFNNPFDHERPHSHRPIVTYHMFCGEDHDTSLEVPHHVNPRPPV